MVVIGGVGGGNRQNGAVPFAACHKAADFHHVIGILPVAAELDFQMVGKAVSVCVFAVERGGCAEICADAFSW